MCAGQAYLAAPLLEKLVNTSLSVALLGADAGNAPGPLQHWRGYYRIRIWHCGKIHCNDPVIISLSTRANALS
jgi:hypothetical protein